ncbi:MAG: hypothetical protein NVV74_04990 [Magnetospirillum sp.]|nr:hypothetical protein [Magnetospirillum sp.]
MSVSAVAPTPFYQDPERLPIAMPQAAAEDKAKPAAGEKHLSMFAEGDDEPSFWDVLDIINPLQHIPIVNDIYQELTGDKIGVGARLVGGTLFGGPIGLVASAVDCMVEESTGQDMGGHMLALFKDDAPAAPGDTPATMVASAAPAEAAPAAPVAAATAKPPAEAAPVIALPQAGAGKGGSQPMVFTLDGVQPAGAPASVAAAPLPPVAASQPARLAQAEAGKPLPLTAQNARYMPTPARNLSLTGETAKPPSPCRCPAAAPAPTFPSPGVRPRRPWTRRRNAPAWCRRTFPCRPRLR